MQKSTATKCKYSPHNQKQKLSPQNSSSIVSPFLYARVYVFYRKKFLMIEIHFFLCWICRLFFCVVFCDIKVSTQQKKNKKVKQSAFISPSNNVFLVIIEVMYGRHFSTENFCVSKEVPRERERERKVDNEVIYPEETAKTNEYISPKKIRHFHSPMHQQIFHSEKAIIFVEHTLGSVWHLWWTAIQNKSMSTNVPNAKVTKW